MSSSLNEQINQTIHYLLTNTKHYESVTKRVAESNTNPFPVLQIGIIIRRNHHKT